MIKVNANSVICQIMAGKNWWFIWKSSFRHKWISLYSFNSNNGYKDFNDSITEHTDCL